MRRVFSPLQLEPLPESPTQVRIVEDGTGLQVPGLPGHSAWSVRWADQGTRLFNRRDADTAEAILAVLGHVATYQTAVERGVQQERSRVAQDLHDDIGARLLTLLHRSQGDTAAAVREVLASLRLSVYGLSAKPRPLAEAFASWRAEASERCEALGTELRWHETAPWPRIKLGSLQELDLARTLREALSNALRHGDRSAVEITLTPSASHLSLSIINRSEDSLPQHWRSGMGLRGMRQRLQRLGGSLQLHGEGGRICLRIELPLSAATQVAK
jgi:signal transduction histidine kinase